MTGFLVLFGLALTAGVALAVRDRRRQKRAQQQRAALAEQHRQWAWYQYEEQRRLRWEHLCARFGHDAAERIWRGAVKQGDTIEMVVEAYGPPLEIREKVLKSTHKQTFCYDMVGTNRYSTKILFEDGVCVGWED